jgi:hypothetical protein
MMLYTLHKAYLRWCLARNYAFRDEVSRSYQMELARIDRATQETERKIGELETQRARKQIRLAL